MSIDQKALAIATFVLYLKFLITLSIQGKKRFEGGSRPPEDTALSNLTNEISQSYGQANSNIPEKARMDDIRWQRIVMNDLENIPLGLIVAIVSILVDGNSIANCVFLSTFTLCRCAHTLAYAYEKQPFRSYFWIGATLSVLGMAINAVASL
jgi:glutathione S-transferase